MTETVFVYMCVHVNMRWLPAGKIKTCSSFLPVYSFSCISSASLPLVYCQFTVSLLLALIFHLRGNTGLVVPERREWLTDFSFTIERHNSLSTLIHNQDHFFGTNYINSLQSAPRDQDRTFFCFEPDQSRHYQKKRQ